MNQLSTKKIHRAAEIPIYTFGRGFIEEAAGAIQRRAEMSISITERQVYLDVNGQAFTTTIEENRDWVSPTPRNIPLRVGTWKSSMSSRGDELFQPCCGACKEKKGQHASAHPAPN